MWVVKEQSKRNPNGIPASPVMETQSGAKDICERLQAHHDAERKDGDDIKHYFISAHIKRGTRAK